MLALRLDANRLGEVGVEAQPLVVTVEREDVLRLGQVEHQLQLLLPAVTRGVDRRVGRGDDLGPDLEDPIDRLVHRVLVARDGSGGKDHGVPGVQLDVRVVPMGHPAKG
jgi:hypothetical protein